jgi:hypothetical protein
VRHKGLIISTVIFFLIVNTNYFWQAKIGILAIPTFLLLVGVYIVLAGLLIGQLFFSIREKFANKQRVIVLALLATVLTLTILKPTGLINFDKLEGKDLFIAQREGAANCMITFKLKENNKFLERSVCFSMTEIRGDYELKGDTIIFSNVELGRGESKYYEFAVIKQTDNKYNDRLGDLIRYKDQNDTTGQEIWIIKNDLTTNKN